MKNDKLIVHDPSTWTTVNIDKVAALVKNNPSAEYSSAFWNIYNGPFGDVPCNKPLRSIIIKTKKSHSVYHTISDEEYLGDVIALMGEKVLYDWNPAKESLEHYIGCRCRPNAEYGCSILKAHGHKVYALVKINQDGSFNVCDNTKCGRKNYPDYRKKYINSTILPVDEQLYSRKVNLYTGQSSGWSWKDDFEQIELRSVRSWLMETCHVSEYELSICEAISSYGKCLDPTIVHEINERIVLPAGNSPLTQKELYQLNFRVHKRACHYYHKAMSGIR